MKITMREEHKQRHTPSKAYITSVQRKELIKQVGDSAALLYTHYFDKAVCKSFDIMDDEQVAKDLGWAKRKTQKHRLLLIKMKWVFKKTSGTGADKVHITILGQQLVKEYFAQHSIDTTKYPPMIPKTKSIPKQSLNNIMENLSKGGHWLFWKFNRIRNEETNMVKFTPSNGAEKAKIVRAYKELNSLNLIIRKRRQYYMCNPDIFILRPKFYSAALHEWEKLIK